MINYESYMMFVVASIVLCIVPGPDMIYLLSRSIAQGKKAGALAAVGINLGAYFHLAAAITGLSAILAASALAFDIIKWLGAGYLCYLGLSILFSKDSALVVTVSKGNGSSAKSILWQGFLSDVLNPKVALFFLALLPQFIDNSMGNETRQLIILGFTVNIIALCINMVIVYCASQLTSKLRQSLSITQWLNKAMGFTFITLGLRLANEKLH